MAAGALDQITTWFMSPEPEGPLLLVGDAEETVAQVQALAACHDPAAGTACGVCRGCRGALPTDVIVAGGAGERITIAVIRDIQARAAFSSFSLRRLIVLRGADRLTLAAANALLKLLEESSAQTRFLLTTQLPGKLLPTILSRCRRVRLPRQLTHEPANAQAAQLPLPRGIGVLAAADRIGETEIAAIGTFLLAQTSGDPTPQLKRALLRLRDYHQVAAVGGNVRLAKEVLLASLLPFAS